jgi:hypothetical protein
VGKLLQGEREPTRPNREIIYDPDLKHDDDKYGASSQPEIDRLGRKMSAGS